MVAGARNRRWEARRWRRGGRKGRGGGARDPRKVAEVVRLI
jgi:hypothetical protein